MSGRKNRLVRYPTINAGNMATSTLTSAKTNIEGLDNIGIQYAWTGNAVGTFAIQISADYQQDMLGNVLNAGNWVTIAVSYWDGSATQTVTAIPTTVGSPIYVDLAFLSAPWIRTVYTKISGTGSLTATITGKQV